MSCNQPTRTRTRSDGVAQEKCEATAATAAVVLPTRSTIPSDSLVDKTSRKDHITDAPLKMMICLSCLVLPYPRRAADGWLATHHAGDGHGHGEGWTSEDSPPSVIKLLGVRDLSQAECRHHGGTSDCARLSCVAVARGE